MQRVTSRLLVPFTIAMIAAGLWQVGGPEQARVEQRDDMRLNDLYALESYLECERNSARGADLTCGPAPRERDRFTDQPFVVTETRLCAPFEQPDRIARFHDGRIIDGCVTLD